MVRYDQIVSLGTQCAPALTLDELGRRGPTYPFDWIKTNSKLVYHLLTEPPTTFTTLGAPVDPDYHIYELYQLHRKLNLTPEYTNGYGQFFKHFLNCPPDKLTEKLHRQYNRLIDLLESGGRVLFIQTHEEHNYHRPSRERADEYYDYLYRIHDLLEERYPNLDFTILNIDHRPPADYKRIVNRTIDYNLPLSDHGEHLGAEYYQPYRDAVTEIVAEFLAENE